MFKLKFSYFILLKYIWEEFEELIAHRTNVKIIYYKVYINIILFSTIYCSPNQSDFIEIEEVFEINEKLGVERLGSLLSKLKQEN